METKKHYSSSQAAQYLNCSISSIDKLTSLLNSRTRYTGKEHYETKFLNVDGRVRGAPFFYKETLDAFKEKYNFNGKGGRHLRIATTIRVNPYVRDIITLLSKKHKISKGETILLLANFYLENKKE